MRDAWSILASFLEAVALKGVSRVQGRKQTQAGGKLQSQ